MIEFDVFIKKIENALYFYGFEFRKDDSCMANCEGANNLAMVIKGLLHFSFHFSIFFSDIQLFIREADC